jgi:hypothetical protein
VVSGTGNIVLILYWLFFITGINSPPHLAPAELVSYSIAGGTGSLVSRAINLVAKRLVLLTGDPTTPEFPVNGYNAPQQPAHQKRVFMGYSKDDARQSAVHKVCAIGSPKMAASGKAVAVNSSSFQSGSVSVKYIRSRSFK